MISKDSAPVVIASPSGITLRSLEPAHAFALLATIKPHRSWLPQFGSVLTLDEVEEFCQYGQHSTALEHGLMAGIWQYDVLIGHAGVHSRDPDGLTGALSCWIAPPQQRQNLAHHAATLVIDHAFMVLGMKQIEALAAQHNQRAARFLTRLNFKSGETLNHRRPDYTTLVCRQYILTKD